MPTNFMDFVKALIYGDIHDPIFWLHHANIDRLWAQWQQAHPGQNPPNLNETLRPAPIIQGRVSAYVDIAEINYSYA